MAVGELDAAPPREVPAVTIFAAKAARAQVRERLRAAGDETVRW